MYLKLATNCSLMNKLTINKKLKPIMALLILTRHIAIQIQKQKKVVDNHKKDIRKEINAVGKENKKIKDFNKKYELYY